MERLAERVIAAPVSCLPALVRRIAGRVAAGELPPPPPPLASAEERREVARRRISPGRSLAALRPDLVQELHPTRNGEIDPSMLGPYSVRKLWWHGRTCGHEWRTSPQSRVSGGYGCPWRAVTQRAATRQGTFAPGRSLAALRPDLAEELRDLDPNALGTGSRIRARWCCPACGHEWSTTVKHRVVGSGSPCCVQLRVTAGRRRVPRERSLGSLQPGLAEQLHPTRNGKLDAYSLGINTRQDVWWRCPQCEHAWRAGVRGRAAGSGCPRCGGGRGRKEHRSDDCDQ